MERRQVIQQLLVGDLADLADEHLYRLLPGVSSKTRTSGKWRGTSSKSQRGHTAGANKQRWQQNNNLPGVTSGNWGGSHGYGSTAWGKGAYAAKYDVSDKPLCYKSLAEKVAQQLRGVYSEDQITQLLKKSVFPELNLRSYLACRSELDLDTVRLIIRDRPGEGDEANELDHSLTMATAGRRRKPTKPYRPPAPALTKKPAKNSQSTNLKNSYNNAYKYNRIEPNEWED